MPEVAVFGARDMAGAGPCVLARHPSRGPDAARLPTRMVSALFFCMLSAAAPETAATAAPPAPSVPVAPHRQVYRMQLAGGVLLAFGAVTLVGMGAAIGHGRGVERERRQALEDGVAAMWRGTVDVRCEHLDADAVQWAYVETLRRLDARLQRWAPQFEPGDWDFGLAGSGMTDLQAALEQAASLRGWDAPEVRERTNRLLAAQLCFERAAAPEVARRARRSHSGRLGELQLAATDYRCEAEPNGDTAGRLTVEITSHSDGLVPVNLRLVLAGGRELALLPEQATVAGREIRQLDANSTATVIYRVEVPLRADHALTRPMLLRQRRWQLSSASYRVEDLPLRLAN